MMKFKFLLLSLSVVAALFVIEAGLRIYYKFDSLRVSHGKIAYIDDSGLTRYYPNLDLKRFDSESRKYNHVKTNSEGFMGEDHALITIPPTKRIAVMGDSFVASLYNDYEKIFTTLLSKKMSDGFFGGNVTNEAMNFGVGGAGTVEELLYYQKYVKKYHPDIVVLVYIMGNDYLDTHKYLDRKDEILNGQLNSLKAELGQSATNTQQNKGVGDLKDILLTKSALLRLSIRLAKSNDFLFKFLLGIHVFKNPFYGEFVSNPFGEGWLYMDPRSEEHKRILKFNGDVVSKLANDVKENGGKFFLVIIPSYWEVDNKYVNRLNAFDYPLLDTSFPTKFLKDQWGVSMPILDLTQIFKKKINEDQNQLFNRGSGHLTEDGDKLVAEQIYSFLKENFSSILDMR